MLPRLRTERTIDEQIRREAKKIIIEMITPDFLEPLLREMLPDIFPDNTEGGDNL